MEPATEKQGGVASCQSHCWGIVSQTCTRRRVGEGPLLSQGGGKKETAIVGTVPEAWTRLCPNACGIRLSCRFSECFCVSVCLVSRSSEWFAGLFLVQGHPHPWTPRCLQLVPGHPFVPPTTTLPSAAQHKALQVGLVPARSPSEPGPGLLGFPLILIQSRLFRELGKYISELGMIFLTLFAPF